MAAALGAGDFLNGFVEVVGAGCKGEETEEETHVGLSEHTATAVAAAVSAAREDRVFGLS